MLAVMKSPGDLEPRYDPIGGSPKTPIPPISAADYQQYVMPAHGNGIFKMLAGAAGGLWIMAMLAWWTAFQGKGITRDELRNEMKEYKDSVAKIASDTDVKVGELRGKEDQLRADVNQLQYRQSTDERDFTEFKTDMKSKMGTVADYLESQKTKK